MKAQLAVMLAVVGCCVGAACTYSLGPWSDCQVDPQSCGGSGVDWPTYADCTAKAPLQFDIGSGEKAYAELAPGVTPTVHFASGGGQGFNVRHINLGVRIANPDPVRRRFRVEARTYYRSSSGGGRFAADDANCTPDSADASVSEPPPGASTPTWHCGFGGNTFVVDTSLKQAADGSLSRGGLRVFVHDLPHVLEVSVSDQCGRTTHAARTFRTD